jgi:hypothetical protein
MSERTPEQYAIEHGRYLADAARRYMRIADEYTYTLEEGAAGPDRDQVTDAWRTLQDAIHEFEKCADRACPKNAN